MKRLEASSRGSLDRKGIYQLALQRGEECQVRLYPHQSNARAGSSGIGTSDTGIPNSRENLIVLTGLA